MKTADEAVLYVISVWDEVLGKKWREKPYHVGKKFLSAEYDAKGRRDNHNRKYPNCIK